MSALGGVTRPCELDARHFAGRYALKDARGIHCAYVCERCEASVRSRYRPEIFTDPNYWTDEPVEPEQ